MRVSMLVRQPCTALGLVKPWWRASSLAASTDALPPHQDHVNMVFLSSPLSGPELYLTSAGAW